jgi:hypothetical protein
VAPARSLTRLFITVFLSVLASTLTSFSSTVCCAESLKAALAMAYAQHSQRLIRGRG